MFTDVIPAILPLLFGVKDVLPLSLSFPSLTVLIQSTTDPSLSVPFGNPDVFFSYVTNLVPIGAAMAIAVP
jgi:hypothetical protein